MTASKPANKFDADFNYGIYLQLDRMLDLQVPKSDPPEHDEMLFIIIHQTYELWFKQLIHEFDKVRGDLSSGDLYAALHTLKRARTIMKTLVAQVDILETMTPMSFRSFRDFLETASGFQSWQYREFEFQLGYKREKMLAFYDPESHGYARLVKRLKERSVHRHFHDFLEKRGAKIPEDVKSRPLDAPDTPSEELQREILRLYHEDPEAVLLFELMTDFDEGFQEWRYRHVKLVERTIGNKKGTGGSLGVEFLKKSLFQPIFPDLWQIRQEL